MGKRDQAWAMSQLTVLYCHCLIGLDIKRTL